MKGARIPYSEEEFAFLEARKSMPRVKLHGEFIKRFARLDVTADHIKSLCTRKGWKTGRRKWSAADDVELRELYPNMQTQKIAKLIGRTVCSINGHATKLDLHKTAEYLASEDACRLRRGDNVGKASRFKKGQSPPNKGKPMPFHPNSAATRFKKGQSPRNTKWAGHERVSKDGYVEISVEETNPHTGFQRRYVLKHRWLWEQKNGKVPRGMALKCLDTNKLNTDPSNWALVSRGLLPRLNGIHGHDYDAAPAEVRPTILAIAKLEQAATEVERRRQKA